MEAVYRKVLALNVKAFRTKLGLSQEALAEKADLHWTYVSGVERQRYNVSLKNLVKLAKGLGRKPHELLK